MKNNNNWLRLPIPVSRFEQSLGRRQAAIVYVCTEKYNRLAYNPRSHC